MASMGPPAPLCSLVYLWRLYRFPEEHHWCLTFNRTHNAVCAQTDAHLLDCQQDSLLGYLSDSYAVQCCDNLGNVASSTLLTHSPD